MKKIVGAIFFSIFLLCSAATADSWNKKTILTFDEAIQLPGVVLPPGTYVFKVPDFNYRNVVQVYSADESKILATILATSAERDQTTDRSALRFAERPKASEKQLRTWFYPQEKTGREFIDRKTNPTQWAKR